MTMFTPDPPVQYASDLAPAEASQPIGEAEENLPSEDTHETGEDGLTCTTTDGWTFFDREDGVEIEADDGICWPLGGWTFRSEGEARAALSLLERRVIRPRRGEIGRRHPCLGTYLRYRSLSFAHVR